MLDLKSTVKLPSGHTMPLLGYGSYASSGEGVAEALKLGYRHIDSAQMYRNEANIGKAVASSGIPRSEIFLTTKYNPGAAQPAAKVLEALRPSLAKLDSGSDGNSGYIDLFLIHGPGGGEKGRAGNWEAMAQAQKEGWVRDIGVSNFGVRHLTNLPSPKPAVNQIEVHPFCQQRDIVEYCQKNGIVIQAYSPLILADKAKWGNETLVSISKKHERDIAQVLLRWSLQKGFVPLPKSSTPARIQSNAALYDFELDTEDMARLDKLDQGANGAVGWNPVDAP